MKKTTITRTFFYISGLLILALGIILNTKSGLGVSPIIFVSYSISTILHMNFGNMTFILYAIFVLIELILHTVRYTRIPQRVNKKEYEVLRPSIHKSLSLVLLSDLLNISITICVSLGAVRHLIGIGIGTVFSVLGVGRVIALFNHLFMEKMIAAAGVE